MQDFGHISQGDKFSCTVTLWASDMATITGYWDNRTPVTVIDEAGNTYSNMRVVVKGYSYLTGFKKYIKMNIEFWRV